jgi:uncharacterized protein (TIRG00374 family)
MNRAVRYILSGALTILFLVIAFHGTDPRQILEAARDARYGWFAVFLACLLLSHLLRALRWRYLLDPLKRSIGLRNLFSGVMIGYLLNNVLPRAGEIGRPYALARLESLPVSAVFGTIVVERIMDTVMFLLIIAAMPLLYAGPMAQTFPWLIPTGIAASAAIALGLASVVTLMLRRDWTDLLVAKSVRLLPARLAGRLGSAAHSFLDGFLFLTRPGSFLAIGTLGILIWLLYAAMMYSGLVAFNLQEVLDFRAAVVVLAISSIGIAVPTPGGTGSYHILVARSLTGLYGIGGPLALSYATVTHAVSFLGVSIVGAYFFWRDNLTVAEAVHARPEGS